MYTIIKEEDCKNVLVQKYNRSDIKLISVDTKPISSVAQGYFAEHNKLILKYEFDRKELSAQFFLKTVPDKSVLAEKGHDLNAYKQEAFFYNNLFQDFRNRKLDTSFAAKCYYCTNDFGLVLDDMTVLGYRAPTRNKFFNSHEVKCGLEALAKFHGCGFIYEELMSKEMDKAFRLNEEYPEKFNHDIFYSNVDQKKSLGVKWLEANLKTLTNLVDLLPECEEFKIALKKKLNEKEIGKVFFEQTNIRKSVRHGDLWSNNLFFLYENDEAQKCCLLDFQIGSYFYPAHDVLLFLYINAKKDSTGIQMNQYLHHYYSYLSNFVAAEGFCLAHIYPVEDFKTSLKIVEFDAKVHGSVMHSYWCYSAENFNEKMVERGVDFIVGDRTDELKQIMQTNSNFKDTIFGDLYDFYDILCKCC